MGVNLRNDQGMTTIFLSERVHRATTDSSITGNLSVGMETISKEEYDSQRRRWATWTNRKTVHRRASNKDLLSRIQPHLVEGHRLACPVDGEQRLGRVAYQRRATNLLEESHTIDNGQRLLEFVNGDNLPS